LEVLALPPAWVQVEQGPAGGTVWQGTIPNTVVRGARRPSLVYLPPHVSPTGHYRVVFLLQGMPGGPYSFADGLGLTRLADRLIKTHAVPPFVAVMPPAGVTAKFHGEWTGPWERFLVDDVLPWADAHLPISRAPPDRTLAGLSAGGYGAVGIGLRHPGLFGTLEAWSGSFAAPRDGSLRGADASVRAAHDPTLLAEREAPLLRRLGTRFFLSCGSTHDRITAGWTRRFAELLGALRQRHRLWLGPGGHDGRFWRSQLVPALEYALRR
jgi:enterochelin esterase-like enzyme